MRSHLWFFSTVLGVLLAGGQISATPSSVKVIYGDDGRQDYYEISEASVRSAADSTVALIRAANLTQQGDVTTITTASYSQTWGLCAGERFYNQETAATCSGFLVSPDTVVTAGHCIYDQQTCMNTRLVFGFKISQKDVNPRAVPTANVYQCARVVHSVSQAEGEDFAVIKLDRAVTGFAPVTYRTSGKISVGDVLHVIGYPYGLPVKLAAGAAVRAVRDQFLVANLDTYGGNSGSAVFNSVTGEVEGILVRGEMDWVIQNGCRASNHCPDDGCRGEDVTLFERVLPYLDH